MLHFQPYDGIYGSSGTRAMGIISMLESQSSNFLNMREVVISTRDEVQDHLVWMK